MTRGKTVKDDLDDVVSDTWTEWITRYRRNPQGLWKESHAVQWFRQARKNAIEKYNKKKSVRQINNLADHPNLEELVG